jgi:predicted homoserine dehydrogenase-like protein
MIGAGSRGQELLQQTLKVPSLQVVAVADVYNRRFDEAKKVVPGLETFGDYRRVSALTHEDRQQELRNK